MSATAIRIMFVIGSMGNARAGTERNLLTIIEHLDRQRFTPYLVSLQDCDYLRQGKFACDTSCLHLYRILTPTMWRRRRRLAERMRELKIDIVQTFFVEGHLVGGGAARMADVRAIISSRRNLGYSYSLKEKLLLKLANRYPRRFLANSNAVAERIAVLEGLDRNRFDVIHNGVEIDSEESDAASDASRHLTAVMVANLRPVKGVDTFIEAAAEVVRRVSGATFVVIGDGPERERVTDLVGQLQLQNVVSFLGSQSDVRAVLATASVGVLTSISEGFSNAILEYMRAGLPVIATDVGGNREAIVDGKSGFLIPVSESAVLAEKLVYLLTHPQEAAAMGRTGKEIVRQEFSVKRMIQDYQEYYLCLLQKE